MSKETREGLINLLPKSDAYISKKSISFDEIEHDTNSDKDFLTIDETAKFFSVSSATIRNWVKTGLLTSSRKGKIDQSSIDSFKNEQLGKTKLVSRANKSQKDTHNHNLLKIAFLNSLNECPSNLGKLYENSLSDSYRNKEGIYYTPPQIVEDLFCIKEVKQNGTFCDPCCGSGNFILRAIDLGFKPENVYGFDIDPIAVEITKRRIKEKTGFDSPNIQCVDFLDLIHHKNIIHFDYIYTNPPWGKKISKEERAYFANLLQAGKSCDTCSLFFFACLSILKPEGKLGLLLPEAFFNVAVYENARKAMLNYKIDTLKDYGKAFKGLQTGAVAFVLEKISKEENYNIPCVYQGAKFERSITSFLTNPKVIFNLNCTQEEAEIIAYLYSKPHKTLEDQAMWGLGIVTGNNAKYVKSQHGEGLVSIFKGADITKQGLKEATHFISSDFSQYQQVAPIELFQAKEKLIYKFISSELGFYYDTEQRYILNSANMLIVNDRFPVSMEILSQLLNSELMNWLFQKIFKTHKILRSDLEKLPIHTQYLENSNFNEKQYLDSLGIKKENYGTFRIKK